MSHAPSAPASRSAARSNAAASSARYERRTDNGASARVNRLPVSRCPISNAPMSPSRVRSRSLTTTPSRATRAISPSRTTASSGDRWCSTSEQWATSNDRSG